MGTANASRVQPGLGNCLGSSISGNVQMKNEPALDDIRPRQYPQVGDEIDVQGDAVLHLAPGLHKLIIVGIREYHGYNLFDCATPDGELELQICPSEIIDWRKNP